VEGFASLGKLKEISLELALRPLGTKFIFEGLLKLPLLSSFSLRIPFLSSEDMRLLRKFFRKQKDLISISLILTVERTLRRNYLEQNQELTKVIHTFQNTKLQNLYLASSFWSLEALSDGLKELNMPNQLKSLKLEGFDDILTSTKTCQERIEGMCNFIKQQKGSLRVLFVRLPHVLQQTLVNYICDAISKLEELRELIFSMNLAFLYGMDFYGMYFEETLKPFSPWEVREKLKVPKNWNINLAKSLRKLEKLEKFSLSFDIVTEANASSLKWLLDTFRVLSTLQRLRRVDIFTTSTHALGLVTPKVCQAILDLSNVKQVDALIFNDLFPFRREMNQIYDVVNERNNKQSLRTELMF